MRAGRTFPRCLPLCATALVLFQLGGLVHLAAAPHGVCWEHGVVVELEAPSPAAASPAAPVGLARASSAAIRSDQHPHCPALWVLRQVLESDGSATVVASGPHRCVVTAPEPVAPPDGWALRRAPKQSPPV